MTQTHVIKTDKAKLDMEQFGISTRQMVRAQVNADGTFEGRPRRWYIQKIGTGHYRVVHNLNTLNYGVSAGQVNQEPLCIEVSNLVEASFDVYTKRNGELIDAPFVFALNRQI